MKHRLAEDCQDRGAAWFRRGVALAREGRTKEAARAFGMAHHADYRLENAALLTFACLKARDGVESDLVERLIETWRELGSTPVTRTRADRAVMASMGDREEPVPGLSALGRLAWIVLGPAARERVRSRVQSAGGTEWECLVENGAPDLS